MPIDRGTLDKQLRALGDSARWWTQRELRDLPAVLRDDEEILAIARGKIARVRWLRRTWLLVITQRRLVCIRSGRRSWRQIEVNAAEMTRVSLRVGPFRGRVVVVTGQEKYRLLVPRADAYKLVAALSPLATSAKEALPGSAPTRMIRRVVDHVLALPAAALDPNASRPLPVPAPPDANQERVDALEEEVHRLRQQVDFMEQLLRQRQDSSGL